MPPCPRKILSARKQAPLARVTLSSQCLSDTQLTRCGCQQVCTQDTCADSESCMRTNPGFCPHGLAADDECTGSCREEPLSSPPPTPPTPPTPPLPCPHCAQHLLAHTKPSSDQRDQQKAHPCCSADALAHKTAEGLQTPPSTTASLHGPYCAASCPTPRKASASFTDADNVNQNRRPSTLANGVNGHQCQRAPMPQTIPSDEVNCCKNPSVVDDQKQRGTNLPGGINGKQSQRAPMPRTTPSDEGNCCMNSSGVDDQKQRRTSGNPIQKPQPESSSCCMTGSGIHSGPHLTQSPGMPGQTVKNRRPSLVHIQSDNQRRESLMSQKKDQTPGIDESPETQAGNPDCPRSDAGGLFPAHAPPAPCLCRMPPAYKTVCTGNLSGNCNCDDCNKQ